ncbi:MULTISPECIES: DNA-processing protein DprA [unclassified Pseudonocardia]|uniref:DNA-processing protein DprA n=1 Tax=unclassified Pseudonocardia TaxID=2619320 RepID=UPI001D04D34C|nr:MULTISPECIES: DNA-processing protein DprA [unclassified Pseudonocardia]
MWDDAERAALVALLRNRPKRMTYADVVAEVGPRESALDLWHTHNPAGLYGEAEELTAARRDIEAWQAAGLGFLTFLDDAYPEQFRAVHDLPPVLFHRGRLVSDEVSVSVVGSRTASERGLSIARSVALGLVERGVTVVSGLAKGIDAAAHTATLEAGGRAVAVIGTGINRYYPAENRKLQDAVAREGLLLSQFWPDAPPGKHTFPMRNSVMSGYGRATVVVEAGEYSGARIQARAGVAHGRPVILTELVVAANQWAQKLVGQPGVHVADSTATVMRIVEDIVKEPGKIDAFLAPAASGWG